MPLKFESVFIVTYGRSGSTLLQGVLNTIPGVMIRGENRNIFSHFYMAYTELLQMQARHPHANRPSNPWYGSCWFSPEQFKRDLYALGKNLLRHSEPAGREPIDVFGFKEIRVATMADPVPYLSFLLEVFPRSCIIHLTRDHHEVAASQKRKFKVQQFDPATIVADLASFDRTMKTFGEGNPRYCWLDYAHLKDPQLPQLIRLFDFLGAPFDSERVQVQLSIRHSY